MTAPAAALANLNTEQAVTCEALTPRTGKMKPCGATVVADGRCAEHLERRKQYGS